MNRRIIILLSLLCATLSFGVMDYSGGYLRLYQINPTAGISISANGNVGIGTTVPGALLDVKGASTGRTLVGVLSDSTGYGAVGFQSTLAAANYALAGNSVFTLINAPTGAPISFAINNAEKMRVNSDGNVGIGTANPGVKLDVAGGTIRVQDTGMASSGKGLELIYIPGTDNGYVQAYNRDTTAYKVLNLEGSNVLLNPNSGGNVGIAMASPGYPLHVNGNIAMSPAVASRRYFMLDNTSTGTGMMVLQAGAGSSGYGGALNLYAHSHATKPGWATIGLSAGSGGKFTVNDQALGDGTDVFTVQQNGNVGIGTTVPDYKLEIRTSVANGRGINVLQTGSSGTNIGILADASGAGTTNYGGYFSASGATNNYGVIIPGPDAGINNYTLYSSGTAKAYFAGNVGIGTASPGEALHVVGKIKSSSNLIWGNGAVEAVGTLIYGTDWKIRGGVGETHNIGTYEGNVNFGASITNGGNYNVNITPSGTGYTIINGNVGIGTTAPGEKLEILSNMTSIAEGNFGLSILSALSQTKLAFGASNAGAYSVIQSLFSGTSWSGRPLSLQPNGGNVGIGTAVPGSKLDIYNAGTGTVLRIGGNSTGTTNDAGLDFYAVNGGARPTYARIGLGVNTGGIGAETGYLDFSTISNGFLSEKMRITAGGNVGIGTATPDEILTVKSTIGFMSETGSTRLRIAGSESMNTIATSGGTPLKISTTGGNSIMFQTNGVNLMTFGISNVGIGTDSPSTKLDVAGTVSASALQVNGDISYTGGLYDVSDRRLKTQIDPLAGSLEKLLHINGVYYYLKANMKLGRQVGVIAQEVESVLPEAVQTQSSGTKMVDYTRLVPLLIEAVKAQQKQIEQLRLELNSLRHETLK